MSCCGHDYVTGISDILNTNSPQFADVAVGASPRSRKTGFLILFLSFFPPCLFVGIVLASVYPEYNGLCTQESGETYSCSFLHYIGDNVGIMTFLLVPSILWVWLVMIASTTLTLAKKQSLDGRMRALACLIGGLLFIPSVWVFVVFLIQSLR